MKLHPKTSQQSRKVDRHENIVIDASPLIAFARLNQIGLLSGLFKNIWVTDIVLSECTGNPYFSEVPIIQKSIEKKQLKYCVSTNFSDFAHEIDSGEASTITMAIELKCGVLMDDKAGRSIAKSIGISVIGTVGVLVLAKQKGLVPSVQPLLKSLVKSGYFLSEEIISLALNAADES